MAITMSRSFKDDDLITFAKEAQEISIVPYSHFRVGAALETNRGKIYQAGNIESSSYGLTICAERLAIFKALSEGEREFQRIAIATDTEMFCSPCGACRQVLWDFAAGLEVILVNEHGQVQKYALQALLPIAFDGRFLQTNKPDKNGT
jgi:cytidine deaminase